MKKYLENFRAETGIHISTNMSGKMSGIWSLSTSCKENPICRERAKKPDSICSRCFAEKTISHYGALAERLKVNTKVLSTFVIAPSDFPLIQNDKDIFRIESFGDLVNSKQACNYLNFAVRNPETTFAWWSKNPEFIAQALHGRDIPKNVVFILSAEHVDMPYEMLLKYWDFMKSKYPFLDKIFAVYTKEYLLEHGLKSNCGARSCDTCRRCYSKRTADIVIEILK